MDDEGLSLAMSHNGRYIATGGSAAVVKLWGYDAADLIFEGKGHSGAIAGLRYTADVLLRQAKCGYVVNRQKNLRGFVRNGHLEIAAGESRVTPTTQPLPRRPPSPFVVPNFSFSPDDKQLTSVGEDGNIFIWNIFG